ncbi:MAG TPA: HAMP domain-containing histidine kinase [Candidatus Agathobaculum merdigallinarum]|nr:HAMP domain-containing histidine kinase [Candidatus Agathobaculum merdigallinarum]
MKHLSVKQKLTLWITLLMLLLVSLVLVFMIAVSSSVVTEYTFEQLSTIVRANLTGISQENGALSFSEDFSFTRNGVYTLVYSKSGALQAGQPPLSFPEGTGFENGMIRTVSSGEDDFYVLDYWLHFGWEDGVWVRGVISAPDTADVLDELADIALLLLPVMVIVSGLGAYLLARSTFRPIDRMIRTVSEINEGRDLSRRIGLPPGRDEISRLGQAFDNMFARLETSFESEKQFTSDASHELRTPVAVILAQCEDARRNARTAEQYEEAIEVIGRQAGRMSDLIAQLLQMTRLEQGTQSISMEQADISSLVEVICEEQPALPRGITLQADIQPEIEAWFDVTLMSRLLQNLINNAARYGRENGHIWVVLRCVEEEVILSVRDDGIGIPADRLDKIWKRFYQVESARGAESGAGLGLTMVRQIAELHGGTVTVDSREGEGSCFTLRFPVHPYNA